MGGDGCDCDGGDGFAGVYLSPTHQVIYVKYIWLFTANCA